MHHLVKSIKTETCSQQLLLKRYKRKKYKFTRRWEECPAWSTNHEEGRNGKGMNENGRQIYEGFGHLVAISTAPNKRNLTNLAGHQGCR